MRTPTARPPRTRWLPRLAIALLGLAAASSASALELRILSAGAVEPGIRPALAAFTRASGHTTQLAFAAAPALRSALADTPSADVIIVTQGIVDELAARRVPIGDTAPIGKVGVGIAVGPGADLPDVSSAGALAAALASADTVVFNRASSGLYIERMLQRLGLSAVVDAKAAREPDGASVMRRLLAGTARREFGFGAITEIVLFRDRGVRLVGPLPAPLQNYTSYVALPWPGAPATEPARREAIAALMRQLQGSEARSIFTNAGIEPTH